MSHNARKKRTRPHPTWYGEAMVVRSVRLTAEQIAYFERLGDGSLTAGVREAFERLKHMKESAE